MAQFAADRIRVGDRIAGAPDYVVTKAHRDPETVELTDEHGTVYAYPRTHLLEVTGTGLPFTRTDRTETLRTTLGPALARAWERGDDQHPLGVTDSIGWAYSTADRWLTALGAPVLSPAEYGAVRQGFLDALYPLSSGLDAI